MKKIYVHDTVNNPNMQRGVDRCFFNYANALTEVFPERVKVLSKRISNFPEEAIFFLPSKYLHYPIPKRFGRFIDIQLIHFLANSYSDLYYSPYYGNVRLNIPQVFTAYDMIYEKFPNYFPGEFEKKFIKEKKDCFDRARLILCISQSTANDIKELYPDMDEGKLRVIYIGVEGNFREFTYSSVIDNKPYFLYVGNRSLYKNFPRFLQAFGKSDLSKKFRLRIISPVADFPSAEEKEIITKYRLENDIDLEISVSDAILHERYSQAFAYVCPSEYEGFGLPMMEAMASGTLVLSSNASSLPEIGGMAPIYFDPLSEDSMIETLRASELLSTDERKNRISNGVAHSLNFTWENSKKNFIEAITSII